MKFYTFNQNNSGGFFVVDNEVAHHVIIEAENFYEANKKAIEIGIYFNGCVKEIDCDCCGDRWHKVTDWDFSDSPKIYSTPVEDYNDFWAKNNEPYCHVYYSDGNKKTYKKGK